MVPSNKGQKLPPEPLTQDEMRRLIRAYSNLCADRHPKPGFAGCSLPWRATTERGAAAFSEGPRR